jgi:hypothetical protein
MIKFGENILCPYQICVNLCIWSVRVSAWVIYGLKIDDTSKRLHDRLMVISAYESRANLIDPAAINHARYPIYVRHTQRNPMG